MTQNELDDFGFLLNETWQQKRSLSSLVSNPKVDKIYSSALSVGALGGKLSGAGGGGFLQLYVPSKKQEAVKKKLSHLLHVPYNFETNGSQIIFYDQHEEYKQEEKARAKNTIQDFLELKDLK